LFHASKNGGTIDHADFYGNRESKFQKIILNYC
jgi:hypothetical protein